MRFTRYRPPRRGFAVAVAAFLSTLIGIGFVSAVVTLFQDHATLTAAFDAGSSESASYVTTKPAPLVRT